jgi:methylthioribose-1-phosphate isomerase
VDLQCRSGADIPVEQRDPDEVAVLGERRVVPCGVAVRNPAFDITPGRLVTAIITDAGIATRPYRTALRRLQVAG